MSTIVEENKPRSKPRVVCFASAKGGSGKTITAATLAVFLDGLGRSVVLVDTDASTNGLTLFNLKAVVDRKSVASNSGSRGVLQSGDGPPAKVQIGDHTWFVPATYSLQQTDGYPLEDFRSNLGEIVTSEDQDVDFIFLDAQAGSDVYARASMEFADDVVFVTEFDPISSKGVERLKHVFADVLVDKNSWILFNKILPEFVSTISDILGIAGYLSPIPWDPEVIRSFVRGELPINMQEGSPHTLAVMTTALSLFGSQIETDLKEWRLTVSEKVVRPAQEHLDSLETEIAQTERGLIDISHKLRDLSERTKRYWVIFWMILSVILISQVIFFAGYYQDYPSYLSIPELIYEFVPSMSAMVVFVWAFFAVINWFAKRRARRKEISLEATRLSIERILSDKKEERKKYRTIVQSTLERYSALGPPAPSPTVPPPSA